MTMDAAGPDGVEQLLVGAPDVVDVPRVGEVHARADDVVAAEPQLLQARRRPR